MYLLDTNIVSETRKRQPAAAVINWFHRTPQLQTFMSVLTIGEIRRGVELTRRRDPVAAASRHDWLRELETDFADRIVSVTIEIAQRWGALNAPNPLPAVDGLLAATALVNDWTLVTRNVRDVERTGVRTLNPFES